MKKDVKLTDLSNLQTCSSSVNQMLFATGSGNSMEEAKQVSKIYVPLDVLKSGRNHGVCNREVRFNQAGQHFLPLLGERAGVRAGVNSEMCEIYNAKLLGWRSLEVWWSQILVLLTILVLFAESAKAANPLPASLAQVAYPSPPATQASTTKLQLLLLSIAAILMAFMIFRKAINVFIVPQISDFLTSRLQLLGYRKLPALATWPETLAEDEDISRFIAGFRTGPVSVPSVPSAPSVPAKPVSPTIAEASPEPVNVNKKPEPGLLKEFFAWVPGHITEAAYLVERINRVSGRPEGKMLAREKLGDLTMLIGSLKTKASLPELVPVSQIALALEGLLKQLKDRVENITPSTLRTISGAIDLLGRLCVSELRADLATNPPIRILVVDDDAVSRFALGSALKKVFDNPDFAENGEVGLGLAGRQAYDIVFLDVRMPGMDGFEVCSKIRAKDLNRSTPVVFVTSLKDFESQTTTVLSGGSDLIAKPFLTFEIAVKALTLVLNSRVKLRDLLVEDSNATVSSETPQSDPQNRDATVAVEASDSSFAAAEPAAPAFSTQLLTKASAGLAEMRTLLQEVGQTVDEAGRREKLVTVHLRLQALTRQLDVPESRPAFQLCSALQGLLKKLQDQPANAGASTLGTATAALEALNDLCVKGVRPDLATTPPINILVVDDEPLSRRAIVGALQTAFLKPDSAESGEAALALAREKAFDVIFLDVQMPGMDGYQVCTKIREGELNRATPVVFVTSHKDFKARAESARSGGSDFVVKPFLFVEITVKALTYALRNRLEKPGMGIPRQTARQNIESSVQQSEAQKTSLN